MYKEAATSSKIATCLAPPRKCNNTSVGVGRVDVAAGKNTVISNRQFFDRGPVETGSNRVPAGLYAICSNI
jgi:hypothetical protein